jgi:Ser/Thr protein kinase RdoA (MazF antagonist)
MYRVFSKFATHSIYATRQIWTSSLVCYGVVMAPFKELKTRAQVARLRRVALQALEGYDLREPRLKLLNHGFNTTFRVDTAKGQKFALRLNVNSRRSEANIRAEVAWLEALARETDLNLPTPQRTKSGANMQWLPSSDLGRDIPAALFSWLPGQNIGTNADLHNMRTVGRAMATLHQHASSWTMPEGCELPLVNDILCGFPNRFEPKTHEALTLERCELFNQVLERAQTALETLFETQTPIPLHFDLHNWNLKWTRGKLYVFDFDDSVRGIPTQDISTNWYYLRSYANNDALETAMLAGYSEIAKPPVPNTDVLEALIAGRGLLLLNDLLVIETAEERAYIPKFVATSELRLRHYLETGRFDAKIKFEEER